jgi:phosphatidylinositol alpha-1,6-mannosyltransferase
MKKSLLITLEFPPTIGGIATYCDNLATYLSSNVVVLQDGKKKTEVVNGQTRYTRPLFFPKILWPRWVRGLFHIWHIARKEKIETLLVHHILPIGTIAYILNILTKQPYILFFHGTDIILANERPLKRALTRRIIRRAQACIVNSTFVGKQVTDLEKSAEQKTHVIYPTPQAVFLNPRDEQKIQALTDMLALSGKTVLLTVSRIDEGKGFTHLTRILPKLLEEIPQLTWLVLGDGPKRVSWWKQVEAAGLQGVIRYVGFVPQTELPQYYDLADCFVLLTHTDDKRQEGAGTVFLEAMARTVPVVAGRTGGVPDIVHANENGTLVDVYRGDDLMVEAIVETLTNKEKTLQQIDVAHKEVLNTYRPEKQFEILKKTLLS